jgi:hypothetical protein
MSREDVRAVRGQGRWTTYRATGEAPTGTSSGGRVGTR